MFSKTIAIAALVAIVFSAALEAKLLRHSRYFDDSIGGFDGPYSGATGERAILTVRGARNPYDGSAPQKIAIEDNPYRGPYPRGVYDRLDGYGGRGRGRMPLYPQSDYGYSNYGGYNGGYGGYGPMGGYGAPNRIAVTGAFPYGYGSRFA